MTEIERLKRAIHESNEIWKQGAPEDALKVLDASIAAAITEKRNSWILTLAHHAAVIADSTGNLELVKAYYEQSLLYNPRNPRALYGLARTALQEGKREIANEYAQQCYEAIAHSDDEIERGLLQTLMTQWPEIGRGKV